MEYFVYDLTTSEDDCVGVRDTYAQAVELAFRHIAENPAAVDVGVYYWVDGQGRLPWLFKPGDPAHAARVARTRAAIEAGEPESTFRGLP